MPLRILGGRQDPAHFGLSGDEDIDTKRVVTKWLLGQDADLRPHLEGWLDDFFYRALDYVEHLRNFVVETTLVGTVLNGLGGPQC